MTDPVYPCLWFKDEAYTAAEYYCSIFPDSEIIESNAMVTYFKLGGQRFMALNGGPDTEFPFNESVSFVVECETQEEIDHYWNSFTKEGEGSMCGWCKDKYGVSWQVVPKILHELMNDPERSQRVIKAFLKMSKFDIEGIMNA